MADFEIIKKLIKLVKEEDISGLAVEENGIKYEVRREKGNIAPVLHSPPPPANPANPAIQPKAEDDGLVAITSPMVGTFYRSPSPGAPAFIETGDEIEPGKVVCIVEAMKLFNEIESEVKGKIVKILAENGKPVEYGQKLFLVKKT